MIPVIRQGDVLLVPVFDTAIPETAELKADGVIARGEATGHHHRIVGNAEVFEGYNEIFVRVGPSGASIVHEEHRPATLEPATTYKVNRAREYNYLEDFARTVRD